MNWGIIGHEKQVKFLQKSIQKRRLSHAYLFIGPQGVGKGTVALAFAKSLQCQNAKDGDFCGKCQSCLAIEEGNHPDVHLVSPEGKSGEISIGQIRKLRRDFSLSPLSGQYKIGIIGGADLLGAAAANAFLKTLEEPLGKAVFILTSSSESILPTISSRCQILKFPSLGTAKIEEYLTSRCGRFDLPHSDVGGRTSKISKIARTSMGRPGIALNIVKNPEILETQENLIKDLILLISSDNNYRFKYAQKLSQDKGNISQTLSCWTVFFRDRLMDSYNCRDLTTWDKASLNISKEKTINIIKKLKRTHDIITSTNVNSRLALEVLMLNL